MQKFYVYNNWSRDRGRIHRAECSACNEGRGIQPTDSGSSGEWLGPYDDRDFAFKKAAALGRKDMRPCEKCAP